MKFLHKISIIFLVCLIFVVQITFAQNINDLKSEIYSKLKCCPCEVTFEKCTCKEAKEIKSYIDGLLEGGIAKDEIYFKVAKKFKPDVIIDSKIKTVVEKRIIKEAGGKLAQIVVEPASFNFGDVSKKSGRISGVLKLYNKGNADLVITNLRTSCACVEVSIEIAKDKSPYFGTAGVPAGWQMVIKPKKSGQIELVIDLLHFTVQKGHLVREFSIFSNDPIRPETTVIVEAEVSE